MHIRMQAVLDRIGSSRAVLLPKVHPEAALDEISTGLRNLDLAPFVVLELATVRAAIPQEAERQSQYSNNDDGVLHNGSLFFYQAYGPTRETTQTIGDRTRGNRRRKAPKVTAQMVKSLEDGKLWGFSATGRFCSGQAV